MIFIVPVDIETDRLANIAQLHIVVPIDGVSLHLDRLSVQIELVGAGVGFEVFCRRVCCGACDGHADEDASCDHCRVFLSAHDISSLLFQNELGFYKSYDTEKQAGSREGRWICNGEKPSCK